MNKIYKIAVITVFSVTLLNSEGHNVHAYKLPEVAKVELMTSKSKQRVEIGLSMLKELDSKFKWRAGHLDIQ
jgi:hypothetical protein